MKFEYVKGRWDGDQAKYIEGLAAQGLGYAILERGRDNGSKYVIAAFRRALNGPRPEYLYNLTANEEGLVERFFNAR